MSEKISQPLTIFLLGATGDLARKKILKAIYQLYIQDLLPSDFLLVANARQPLSNDEYIQLVHGSVNPADSKQFVNFSQHIKYVSGDSLQAATYQKLMACQAQAQIIGNNMWYMATLPKLYVPIISLLKKNNLYKNKFGWTKILLEKPFGIDLHTSQDLNQNLLSVFDEEQIYRIDHFLAKETVQNLLVFRFANGLFENMWSNKFIKEIQISSLETLGVMGRGDFYNQTGALRDVVQNHMLQMLAVTLMEEPSSLEPDAIRARRRELLSALQVFTPQQVSSNVCFGQYGEGSIAGQPTANYLAEAGLSQPSTTETAVAIRTKINNERWQGVPIYLRAGKRMASTVTEISLKFKDLPNQMFANYPGLVGDNVLTFRIQPDESVVLRLFVKKPGISLDVSSQMMQFCYKSTPPMELVEAYVKLIYDAATGDRMLFPRADEIDSAWRFVQPILQYKQQQPAIVQQYAAGTWGPNGFSELLAKDNTTWLEPSASLCRF